MADIDGDALAAQPLCPLVHIGDVEAQRDRALGPRLGLWRCQSAALDHDIAITELQCRYGLGGKEFTPQMLKGVFDELALPTPRRRVVVGIADDVSHAGITPDQAFQVPTKAVQAVFFGLGSDGTVGANKASIKLIGEMTALHAQGYFVYDSRKSGSVTVSHLRFGPEPIRSTYLIEHADFVACHQFSQLRNEAVLDVARDGATLLVNAPFAADEVWSHLPPEVQRRIVDKHLDLWAINANKVAREVGMGGRINTIMQPCFFALSEVVPREDALAALKESVEHAYGKRGPVVVQRNLDAIDRALGALVRVSVPESFDVVAGRRRHSTNLRRAGAHARTGARPW